MFLICVLSTVLTPVLAADTKQLLHPIPAKPVAPDFNLLDLDGQRHTLKAYRGKVIILNFWATWCPAVWGRATFYGTRLSIIKTA